MLSSLITLGIVRYLVIGLGLLLAGIIFYLGVVALLSRYYRGKNREGSLPDGEPLNNGGDRWSQARDREGTGRGRRTSRRGSRGE